MFLRHFVCGYEKEYLMKKSADFTSWVSRSRHLNDAAVVQASDKKKA